MTPAQRDARALIGRPGSRFLIPTPALVVDLDIAEANIGEMAQRARAAKVSLRPHAKSHKSSVFANAQISAGAVGVCCAKLGEAEALIAAGIRGILLTSPIVSVASMERAADLAAIDPTFAIVVDYPAIVDLLADVASRKGIKLNVVIDVDVGLGRTGVHDPSAAIIVAQRISSSASLTLVGVQGYGGHWQHIAGFENRLAAVKAGMSKLQSAIDALRSHGFTVPLVTGGGTGTFAADILTGTLNELQPGSYLFMDSQYRDALAADKDGDFAQSLFVQAQVISINAESWVTVDAGLKAFATDGPLPRPVTERFAESNYAYFGDEHGALSRPRNTASLQLGERVEFIPPHCDPTVDRYDVYHFVRQDILVEIAPIEAARRSQ
jgi:D-serine deaminase-like pyridoxal phosphate-dependent protein